MSDYGHSLEFGTFITPSNKRPEDTVALAKLTEQVGLDLATFQDHPYQTAFLDTWTLLSWVLAQTETLRVAANVLNLPLRPPAVLARSAASLDLLSGGRFELGLGAGAFWDAIKAMGGPAREPGESVEALSEAIDVIRALWDTSERGGVFLDNRHYRVWGAKRGPEPAHPMAIWVGAVRPRMLRLIGEKADGWIPSYTIWQGDPGAELDRGNKVIDEAAAAAGRDPREIRRLVNVPSQALPENAGDRVDFLLPMAVEHGVGTFILGGDDPREIEAWGRRLAPALRAAVAAERERRGTRTGGAVRGPKALALRREGIDYEALPSALNASAVEPGDRRYARVRSTYMRSGEPGLVLEPRSVEEVRAALDFARRQPVALGIRSGGHGISGRSTNDGGIVIDVGRLNRVELLDRETGRVRVEPGARWGHVARALAEHGLAMSSGDYGDVGAGGLATAGGIGFLARRYGLTIDHLSAVELISADGRLLRADAGQNSDLFWAMRGAGGNFGVVTAFELDAYPLDSVVYSTMAFAPRDAAALLERWGSLVEGSPQELTSFLYMSPRPGDEPAAQLLNVYAGDDTEAAVRALTPLVNLGGLTDQQAMLVPYAAIVAPQESAHYGGSARPLVSNGFAVTMTRELSQEIVDGLRYGASAWLSVRSVGGAVNDVKATATAYAHRHQNFNVSSVGATSREAEFTSHWDGLRRRLDGLYLSFETDSRPERMVDAFPEPALSRLRRLKALYDPDNVFNGNFAIDPAEEPAGRL